MISVDLNSIFFTSRVKLILLLAFLFFSTSCLSLKVNDKEPPKTEVDEKINLVNKRILLKLTYTDNESTNLSKTKKNGFESILPKIIADFLAEKFQNRVTIESLENPKVIDETFDGYIGVTIIENTISDESTLETIFRGLSFGFYRQYLTKEVKYQVTYEDKQNNKKGQITIKSEFGYQSPMLIIPFNLDKHPFFQTQQIDFHKNHIENLFDKMGN